MTITPSMPTMKPVLAMSPETLSRLIRSFQSRGVLSVRGYQVRVPEVAALCALAGLAALGSG